MPSVGPRLNYGDWLRHWAGALPDQKALIEPEREKVYTYRAFDQEASRLARLLTDACGTRKGDRVAVLCHNRSEVFTLLFACAKTGAVLVPLNWRLAVPELRQVIENAEPRVLFVSPEFAEPAGAASAGICDRIFNLDDRTYQDRLSSYSNSPLPEISVDPEDTWILLYTSGTTGLPKGVEMTYRQVTYNSVNTDLAISLSRDDVTITCAPLFHTGGLNVLSTPLFHRGGTVVLLSKFDPDRVLRAIDDFRCTIHFGVPTMFQMMRESPRFSSTRMDRLRFFLCGGAPCPPALIESYAEKRVPFKQGYGLTEVGPNCFNLNEADCIRKAGTIGKPMFYLRVRLVDAQERDVRTGEIGEVLLAGPLVTKGYFRNPKATAEALRGDWFHTGDLARFDDEGYFTIVDRKKDMFISGGENVYPAEIENALCAHPEIFEAAVISVPDPKWGEVGRAVIVPRSGSRLAAEDVLNYLRERLAKYKVPKHVSFCESLPRNPSGKILKPALRDLYGSK